MSKIQFRDSFDQCPSPAEKQPNHVSSSPGVEMIIHDTLSAGSFVDVEIWIKKQFVLQTDK